MNPAEDEDDPEVREASKHVEERLEGMRREAREISEQAKRGVETSSLRERLKDLKARIDEARRERGGLRSLAPQVATSARDQLMHRRENLRKNLENLDRTLSSKRAGKQRLRQLREKYVKDLQEMERELESIGTNR